MTTPEHPHTATIAAGLTDRGQVRVQNEDAFVIASLGDATTATKWETRELTLAAGPSLLIVADGVGGAASGEIASLMATDTILLDLRRLYRNGGVKDAAAATAALLEAMSAANSIVCAYASGRPQHEGMATTATVALVLQQTLLVAQVGDSRAYLIRSGSARRITKDQTVVQQLVDAGQITEAQAATNERRHIILQALGNEPALEPDIYQETLQQDDQILLCSDGLSNYVTPEEMAHTVSSVPSTPAACRALVELANSRGGRDNITALVARFDLHAPATPPPHPSPLHAPDDLIGRAKDWATIQHKK